jgi:hypothetical protein
LALAVMRRRGEASDAVTREDQNLASGTLSVIRADYLAACDGTHSDVREALGVKTNGLGALDEHYIYVYFGANWSELIRGYDTLFLTLCGRAFDNRLAHPILGDAMAEEIVKSSIRLRKVPSQREPDYQHRASGEEAGRGGAQSAELASNGYTKFAIWAAKRYHGTQSVANLIRSPGFDDPMNRSAGTLR